MGTEPLRLHIGGTEQKPGWKILNIFAGPAVDFVGDCTDLSRFADETVDEVYGSHVYEHLGYLHMLPAAIREVHRVLKKGGIFRMSVPDLEILCRLFLRPDLTIDDRFIVMRMIYGGQVDAADYHKAGLTMEFAQYLLTRVGFHDIERVAEFNLFRDTSVAEFKDERISLNVQAVK
jgi:predicted SAM-dependent methyltransferase